MTPGPRPISTPQLPGGGGSSKVRARTSIVDDEPTLPYSARLWCAFPSRPGRPTARWRACGGGVGRPGGESRTAVRRAMTPAVERELYGGEQPRRVAQIEVVVEPVSDDVGRTRLGVAARVVVAARVDDRRAIGACVVHHAGGGAVINPRKIIGRSSPSSCGWRPCPLVLGVCSSPDAQPCRRALPGRPRACAAPQAVDARTRAVRDRVRHHRATGPKTPNQPVSGSLPLSGCPRLSAAATSCSPRRTDPGGSVVL